MFTAEVQFTIPGTMDEAESIIYDLLPPWHKNGQVLNWEWPFTKEGDTYRTFLTIYQADSLNAKYDDKYARKARKQLAKLGANSLTIAIHGENPFSAQICTCKKHSFYILFTNFLSLESPLRCGDCFGPLPIYKIIPKQVDGIISWQADYQSCDTLQMGCTVGEKFGERELFRHDSNLSKEGISICNNITTGTGISTYYYLERSKARSLASDKKRKCPSCDGNWLLDEPLHNIFDFKCDRCRLLSNIGFSVR